MSGPGLFDRMGRIGATPEASPVEALRRRFLVYMAVFMSGGGILWGTIAAAYGLWTPAIVPYGYTAITIVNLSYFHATKRFVPVRFLQLLVSLLLPFLFQWVLGGWVASGIVMLWAMLAIVGAMTFSEPRSVVRWLVLYAALCVVSALVESTVRVRFDIGTSSGTATMFWAVNTVVVSSVVFGLMIYLGFEREKVNLALEEANAKISRLNESLEDQVADRTLELQAALSQSRAFLDNMADGVTAIGRDGRIQATNPAFSTLLALDGEVAGASAAERLPGVLLDLARRSMATDSVQKADVSLANGRVGAAVASPIHAGAGEGEVLGSVVLVRDVTLEKEVDRMKTDFIATVSHELRTPLTSVLGFAKVTKNKLQANIFPHVPTDDPKARKAAEVVAGNIDIIVSEGERLTSLINDVLDISKMEAGRMEWRKAPASPAKLVQRAAEATTALFQADVAFETAVEEGLPDIVVDFDRMLQVLINLISNASKFTVQGSVTVAAKRLGRSVEFSVIDTGPGIDRADHSAIFEKFRQVGDTLTNKPKGTGLGLPICKQIVTAHEGRIGVRSERGQGSTFFFQIPTSDGAHPSGSRSLRSTFTSLSPGPTSPTESLLARIERHVGEAMTTKAGANVLVVDDDRNLRELVRQQLTERGYVVHQAADGPEAVRKVREKKPDLIILDVMMPGLSGFDVAAILKSDPDTRAIPIIILSIVHDAERGYSAGVDRYLSKPTEADALAEEVRRLVKHGESPRRVLVVNEEVPPASDVVRLLEAKGYEVVGTCAPKAFVEEAKRALPDLVILEAGQPGKDEIYQAIRLEKELSNIFVVQLVSDAKSGGDAKA